MTSSKDQFQQMRDEEIQANTNRGLAINEKSFLNLDKTSVIDMAHAVVEKYTDGHNSPYEGLLLAKKFIDLGEEIKANISDNAANELKLAKSEKRIVGTTTVSEQMVGTRYDFKPCEDVTWNRLKEAITERENFLKTVTAPQITGDPETGETWMAKPAVKSGKIGLIIKY
jgi:hypothetical protein